MLDRRRSKQLTEQLAQEAQEAREKAARLPPGPERAALIAKARRAEVAANMAQWASSPGLRSPD